VILPENQMLDTIIRDYSLPWKHSELQSLYIEANEPSLQNRRLKLSLQHAIKLKANKK